MDDGLTKAESNWKQLTDGLDLFLKRGAVHPNESAVRACDWMTGIDGAELLEMALVNGSRRRWG